MIAVDATLLAYAINRYASPHARAVSVLERLVNGDRPWALPWPAAHQFLRLVTHPHAVARPLAAEDALGFLDGVRASRSLSMLSPTDRHATILRELVSDFGVAARPSRALEIASVLREHGIRELLTTDRTMRRFAFLDVVDPLRDPTWPDDRSPTRRYRRLPRS